MHDLPLPSLKIEGYRLFDHLEIPRLGRVNLITGKNSAGKTSLLEAVRLCAFRGSPRVILDILEARDELDGVPRPRGGVRGTTSEVVIAGLKRIYHGPTSGMAWEPPIHIGAIGGENGVSIGFQWYVPESAPPKAVLLSPEGEPDSTSSEIRPALVVQYGPKRHARFFLDGPDGVAGLRDRGSAYEARGGDEVNCVAVAASGLSSQEVANLWDAISLTPEEEPVVEALRLVAPNLERVSVSTDAGGRAAPVVRAKLASSTEPLPLRSLGDGMIRIFGITLALVSARDGLLLLDEVENGIHYTVHADLWRLVFRTAHRLNVQVFATTHSYDCITAFQQAAQDSEEEGVLIRLDRTNEHVRATLFDEEELAVVAEEAIEVR
jgi:ABC-type transport system involved in cytochrome c biogenesis ATPase subunit